MGKSGFSGNIFLALACATCLVSLCPLALAESENSTLSNVVFRAKPLALRGGSSAKKQITQTVTMGTWISIWQKPQFKGTTRRQRAVPGCQNLQSPFKANVLSMKIEWNVKDSFKLHSMCKTVFFWTDPDCYGWGTYWTVPGDVANPNKYDYPVDSESEFTEEFTKIYAIECELAKTTPSLPPPPRPRSPPPYKAPSLPPPPRPRSPPPYKAPSLPPPPRPRSPPPCNPCVAGACPRDASCSARQCKAVCTCNTKGYIVSNGKCVAPPNDSGCLAPHNAARAAVGVSGLIWNTTLVASALKWANTLRDDNCGFYHSDSPYGENLYGLWGGIPTCAMAVQLWVDEKAYYDYESNTCASGESCGHYTQIVWRDTKRVGCARSTCSVKDGIYLWVCQYDPPGNWDGEKPY